jgi:hypothetical protein
MLDAQPVQRADLRGVNREERRWVLVFAGLVMLITTLPYLFGYVAQGQAYRFTGFVFGVEDGNSYIAKMLAGSMGDWLFRTPYSAYPQSGLLVYIPYLLLGKLAAPPGLHEQLVSLYHIFRIIAGMLAILASYDFIAYFIREIRLRRFGLALVCLGGGLGWLLVLVGKGSWLGSLPLDFYSPEAFGFLGLFGLPHIAMARALMLWTLLAYLRLVEAWLDPKRETDVKKKAVWLAAQLSLLWLLAGVFQPLVLVLAGVVMGWHQLGLIVWRLMRQRGGQVVDWSGWRRSIGWLLTAAILPGVFAAYNLGISFFDPYARIWTAQNVIRSPHILHYLVAYGLLLPFAWLGGRRLMRWQGWRGWLPVGWVLVFPLLAYAPLDLQRRLTEGVWVAWCILAMAALEQPENMPAGSTPRRLDWRWAPLWLAFPSTLFLLAGGMLAAWNTTQPVFRPTAQVEVFNYLAANAPREAVILAAFDTSNALPAWAPVRVLAGHGPESIHKSEIEPQIASFFDPRTDDSQRRALLERFGVEYVFWGPAERKLEDWTPASASYLSLVKEQGDYALFQVGVEP